MKFKVVSAIAAVVVGALSFGSAGHAASVVDEWASVKTPAALALKPVTVDTKTTALLMLDFMNQNCGKRPRCVAQIPAMKKLVEAARAAKVLVVYSLIAKTTTADVIKDVAPRADEPHVLSGPDKFYKTDLEKILADKGIKTVIVVGTAANGAVMFTANSAALRGLNVIVPVDGLSAVDPFVELFTVVHMATGPAIAAKATLTRSDMIKF
ncbi:MAG: cysteine hydrolase [Rhizobiales bacterium]|jgi:nicotinamidase-related amidase|nr:cysteine hydrolase [Hyphomicrobiales bacterium]